MGIVILFMTKEKSKDLSNGYNNLWIFFEIILFVLVGSTLDLKYALNNALIAIIILVIGLLLRTSGVLLCLIKTNLTFKFKERMYIKLWQIFEEKLSIHLLYNFNKNN